VDQLDLAQPDSPGMENVHLRSDLGLIGQPGVRRPIFNGVALKLSLRPSTLTLEKNWDLQNDITFAG
jgi:hypothetical protein